MKRRTYESENGTTHLVNRYEGDLVAVTECGRRFDVEEVADRVEVEEVCGNCQ